MIVTSVVQRIRCNKIEFRKTDAESGTKPGRNGGSGPSYFRKTNLDATKFIEMRYATKNMYVQDKASG